MTVRRYETPSAQTLEVLASIPVIESQFARRGQIMLVSDKAFLDAPTVPALVMNGFDAQALQVAVETGKSMSTPFVQLEATRRYVQKRIDDRAARALRRIDRMFRSDNA